MHGQRRRRLPRAAWRYARVGRSLIACRSKPGSPLKGSWERSRGEPDVEKPRTVEVAVAAMEHDLRKPRDSPAAGSSIAFLRRRGSRLPDLARRLIAAA